MISTRLARSSYLVFLFCLVLLSSGCTSTCVSGSGSTTEKKLELDAFTEVSLNIDADLYLSQTNESSAMRIVADDNLIEKIEVRVEGGVLIIDMDGCFIDNGPMELYVNTRKIEAITLKGSGSVYSDTHLVGSRLDLKLVGSGDINVESDHQFIRGDISGSGDIYLSGTTDRFEASIKGSGDLKASSLIAKSANISISGSGDGFLYASDYLEVSIKGSGDVVYSGNPATKELSVKGSGSVKEK